MTTDTVKQATKRAPKGARSKAGSAAQGRVRDGLSESINRSQARLELDPSGRVLDANANFLSLFGYRLEEIVGKTHSLFVKQSETELAGEARMLETLRGGAFHEAEYLRVTKSGQEIWVRKSCYPVFDEAGDGVSSLVMLATDITAKKNKQLMEIAELKTRTEIMNRTSLISETDLRGHITFVNDKFCEVSLFEREELIGKPHNFVRHPDMPKEVFKELWATIGRGKIFRSLIKNRKSDGGSYYVDAVIAPVLGENGKPQKYIGVRYDITEAETERQNMKAFINAIDSVYAYVEFDMDGIVTHANRNFLDLMRYQIGQVIGEHHRIFVSAEDARSAEYLKLWSDIKVGKSQNDIFKQVSRDGSEVWLQASFAPVTDEKGVVRKVIMIATDVTDRFVAQERERTLTEAGRHLRGILREVAQNAQSIASASQELAGTSMTLATTAEEQAGQSTQVATAAEEISRNVSSVATGTEEVGANIRETAKSAAQAAKVASGAVTSAQDASNTVARLGVSSQDIGKVVKVITSIAQQTNLLALNATIEAARAGEAGKGFAVVANEVKELAKETARATEDISQRISAIQGDTERAVVAIEDIVRTISRINDIQTSIATSVEEQTATTGGIVRNISEVAKGSSQISQNIAAVAKAAGATTESATRVQGASAELASVSEALRKLVAQFEIDGA